MVKFQATLKYFAVFVALVACNDFLLTHGRQIKPSNQHVSIPSSENKVDSPMMPNYAVPSFGDSDAPYTNGFRPTAPGCSPGVGHCSFSREDNNMKAMVVVKSPNVEVSMTEGSKNDFKPTNPGHSPGVGHALQNKIEN
ncbi:precursor of CEP9-like [Gastrolobium bilobum]|uniref:precursor of CEP9-like n=1 Tax=Gastrolobium bilobum TaxID=150636 RepID=UPI002AB1DBFC|nr:precursor of CEP9-like [Gastrolobium bilobum]